MVGNVAFRSATFGGFNREDVMRYIERSVQENREMLERANAETVAAREKADELFRLNSELKSQLEIQQSSIKEQLLTLQDEIQEIIRERDSLKDKVDQMEVMDQKMEEMENRFQALRNMSEQQRAELARCKSESQEKDQKIAEQEQKIAGLLKQVEKMRSDSESYHTVCANIGQIEMDVRYRVAIMERNAQKQIEEKMEEAQASYDNLMASARGDADTVRQRVLDQVEQAREDFSHTAYGVNDSIDRALNEVNQIQSMLQALSGCMDGYVDEINRLTESVDENPAGEEALCNV